MASMLTSQQLSECVDGFKKYAKDRVKIDSKQLPALFKQVGYTASQTELKQLKIKCKLINRKTIVLTDLLKLVARRSIDLQTQQQLIRIFKIIDKEQKGLISSSDIKQFLIANKQNLTDAQIDGVIHQNDQDGDGFLDFQQFIVFIMSI